MITSKKIAYACVALSTVFALTGCHPKVAPVSNMDKQLSCAELSAQISEVKATKVKIEEARGFSGRNVAMGILFWPGVVINEVTGNTAETEANTRLVALENIYCDKCTAEGIKDVAAAKNTKPSKKG